MNLITWVGLARALGPRIGGWVALQSMVLWSKPTAHASSAHMFSICLHDVDQELFDDILQAN